jgi:hypothetical protein
MVFVETNCMKEISSDVFMLHFNIFLSAVENDGLSRVSHKLPLDHTTVNVWTMVNNELLGPIFTEFLAFKSVIKFHIMYMIIFYRLPATLYNS